MDAEPTRQEPLRQAARIAIAVVGALVACVILLYADTRRAEGTASVLLGSLLILGALVLAASKFVGPARRDAVFLAGAAVLASLALLHHAPPTWAVLPGIAVLAWTLLGPFSPEGRVAAAVLAVPAIVGAMMTLPYQGTFVAAVPLAMFVLATWARLPADHAYRPWLLGAVAAGTGLMLLVSLYFLLTGPTLGRFVACALAVAVLAGLRWLHQGAYVLTPRPAAAG